MATKEELEPIIRLAPSFMSKTGFDKVKANEVLCTYGGVSSLYDLNEAGIQSVAHFMRTVSVVGPGGSGRNS